jgi:transcriptional regulator with GAF, ATPase, and Fis domain
VLGATASPGDPSAGLTRPASATPPNAPRPAEPEDDLRTLTALPYHEAKDAWTERFDRAYVEEILRRSGGNVSRAAREAGVDRRHLQRLMARFGVRSADP